MYIYLLYFLVGGTVVAAAVYIGSRAGGATAALVAALPIIDTINVTLLYRNAGANASVAYAKTILCFVPLLVGLLVMAIFLLPHLNKPHVLYPSLSLYALPLVVRRILRHRGMREHKPAERRPKKTPQIALKVNRQKSFGVAQRFGHGDKPPPRRSVVLLESSGQE